MGTLQDKTHNLHSPLSSGPGRPCSRSDRPRASSAAGAARPVTAGRTRSSSGPWCCIRRGTRPPTGSAPRGNHHHSPPRCPQSLRPARRCPVWLFACTAGPCWTGTRRWTSASGIALWGLLKRKREREGEIGINFSGNWEGWRVKRVWSSWKQYPCQCHEPTSCPSDVAVPPV